MKSSAKSDDVTFKSSLDTETGRIFGFLEIKIETTGAATLLLQRALESLENLEDFEVTLNNLLQISKLGRSRSESWKLV